MTPILPAAKVLSGVPLVEPSEMTEYIDSFGSEIDDSTIREAFPEITDSETPVWTSGPSMLSMADKYFLALVVLLIHMAFFFGEWKEAPEGEGQLNFLYSLAIWLVDTTGVLGFVVTMLVLTKVNHFANFSTSGRWTTIWLLASTMVPFSWKLMDFMEWSGDLVGTEFSSPLPEWNYGWFPFLGIASFTMMVFFTLLYQRSFQYAITDKRIHIRKKFLYFDTSMHGISFLHVENLKADPTILGRIFGFGNVHIITGSSLGTQVESLGMSVGGGTADVKEAPKGVMRLFSMFFGLLTKQRNRTVMATDPADCLYGIRKPMGVYRLINELIDKDVGPAGMEEESTPSE